MAFRKRNVGVIRNSQSPNVDITGDASLDKQATASSPGTRPSPVDGRLTTSTGTASLDSLTGHAGLPMGQSMLVEENGTTDYAGVLLKYFAAEGLAHGHKVLVAGVGEQWGRELPGIVAPETDDASKRKSTVNEADKMKIAWRYESLGEFGSSRRAPERGSAEKMSNVDDSAAPFCHTFDLTKRFPLPQENPISYVLPSTSPTTSPFTPILAATNNALKSSPSNFVHRLVLPAILSPAIYPSQSSHPAHVLQFLHSLRALIRTNSTRLVAMLSLPLDLHPRNSSMTRWIEHLCDGAITLLPFPYEVDAAASSGATTQTEEKPQGLVRILKVPVQTERGMGGSFGGEGGEDLAFTVSRKRFTIRAFSLPPVEGDEEGQRGGGEGGGLSGKDMEF
ncbi:MAG: hypothetical protein M1820_001134 [Bogoriella megaspora]|nr:MAG: hypothetical protein M1820_001134 [Bogoriella megaspora]